MANVDQNQTSDARARAASWVLGAYHRGTQQQRRNTGWCGRLVGRTPQGTRQYDVLALHRPTFHRKTVECFEVTQHTLGRDGRPLHASYIGQASTEQEAIDKAAAHFERDAAAWREKCDAVERGVSTIRTTQCTTCGGSGSFVGIRCGQCGGTGWMVAA